MLLSLRSEVLRRNHFVVQTARGVGELDEAAVRADTKLVVLCHSLSREEQEVAALRILLLAAQAKVITMTHSAISEAVAFGVPVASSDGPRALVDPSKKLVNV